MNEQMMRQQALQVALQQSQGTNLPLGELLENADRVFQWLKTGAQPEAAAGSVHESEAALNA